MSLTCTLPAECVRLLSRAAVSCPNGVGGPIVRYHARHRLVPRPEPKRMCDLFWSRVPPVQPVLQPFLRGHALPRRHVLQEHQGQHALQLGRHGLPARHPVAVEVFKSAAARQMEYSKPKLAPALPLVPPVSPSAGVPGRPAAQPVAPVR